MFAYCNNNPVNGLDESGKLFEKIGVAIEMFKIALTGDGRDQTFTKGSKLVRALKKSEIMEKLIASNIEKYKASGDDEYTISGSVSLYGKGNRFDYDLSLSVGLARYTMTITQETRTTGLWIFKREQHRTVVTVEIYDTYDFDGRRDDGSLGSQLNNVGYLWQNEGLLQPYDWTAIYTVYGRWEST